jgi:riboflavin transporter FmnP
MNRFGVKKTVTLAMLGALALLCVVLIRIPVALGFLSYEPKDVVLTIAALLYGPIAGSLLTAAVCLVEMVTVSSTGVIGLVMNVLSSCAFLLPVSILYARKRTLSRAVVGLAVSVVFSTCVMLLWNYLITPLYMGVARADVAALLVPFILPFNLLKSGLNAAIVLLLYKPLRTGLAKARLLPPAEKAPSGARTTAAVTALALLFIAVFVLLILLMKGVL